MAQKQHLLLDFWLSESQLIAIEPWSSILADAARHGGGTVLHEHFHQFSPSGITGFVLLAESHISVHTWPEEGIAALDIFTCGAMRAHDVVAHLRAELNPEDERLTCVDRDI